MPNFEKIDFCIVDVTDEEKIEREAIIAELFSTLDEAVFFTSDSGAGAGELTSIFCSSGGRFIGRDWTEGDTGSGLGAGSVAGAFSGRLDVVLTTLSRSCAKDGDTNAAKVIRANDRYQIFFEKFKT